MAFRAQAEVLLTELQAACPETKLGEPVVSMSPGSDPSYLHISVHAHRCIDLTWLATSDYSRFTAAFGAFETISPGEGAPGVKVMCYEQLLGRLQLSTGELKVVESHHEREAEPVPGEGGRRTITRDEARCYFPSEFALDAMPSWRVKKDQRQLLKLHLAEKFGAIRVRKKKKKKKREEEPEDVDKVADEAGSWGPGGAFTLGPAPPG